MNRSHLLLPQWLAMAAAAGAASLAISGTALADRGRHGHQHGGCGSAVRVGIGVSNYGSGFSIGFGNGCYSSRVYSSCRPTYYGGYYRAYPRVVVATPYSYSYDYPRTVVVAQPAVVTQPVVVQQPVVVRQPVVVAQQGQPISEAAQAQPGAPTQPVSAEVEREAEQNRYRDRELGDAYMRMHDADNAARVYKRYLAAWNGDGTVTRNYGLAQIARGETQEGFRNVVRGYALEAGLIKRPLRIEDLGGKVGFERMLDAASSAAGGSNSAEGWATVALLQHASGNKDATVAALQKARDAGLNQSTLDQFTLELVKPSNGS